MLTSAMGVTPPSLYAAFGDKDSLFEEASALYFRRTCEAVDARGRPPDRPRGDRHDARRHRPGAHRRARRRWAA